MDFNQTTTRVFEDDEDVGCLVGDVRWRVIDFWNRDWIVAGCEKSFGSFFGRLTCNGLKRYKHLLIV